MEKDAGQAELEGMSEHCISFLNNMQRHSEAIHEIAEEFKAEFNVEFIDFKETMRKTFEEWGEIKPSEQFEQHVEYGVEQPEEEWSEKAEEEADAEGKEKALTQLKQKGDIRTYLLRSKKGAVKNDFKDIQAQGISRKSTWAGIREGSSRLTTKRKKKADTDNKDNKSHGSKREIEKQAGTRKGMDFLKRKNREEG